MLQRLSGSRMRLSLRPVSYTHLDVYKRQVLTKAGELSTAKVNRAMKAGVWTTCVLPFSLNKQQVDAIFGKTYDRETPNGTQILYFDRVEGTKAIFVRHAYNNIFLLYTSRCV